MPIKDSCRAMYLCTSLLQSDQCLHMQLAMSTPFHIFRACACNGKACGHLLDMDLCCCWLAAFLQLLMQAILQC